MPISTATEQALFLNQLEWQPANDPSGAAMPPNSVDLLRQTEGLDGPNMEEIIKAHSWKIIMAYRAGSYWGIGVVPANASSSAQSQTEAEPIRTVLEKLEALEPMAAPEPICVSGSFFPCLLLFKGWWARQERPLLIPRDDTKTGKGSNIRNVQNWLNAGFELWGPSWDLADPARDDVELFAQIGTLDEANSLPVVVGRGKARKILEDMEGRLAIGAEVRGMLCHRDHLGTQLEPKARLKLQEILERNTDLNYYILVLDEVPGHTIVRRKSSDLYSAYLWQCLIRQTDLEKAQSGLLPTNRAIFLWEHTNLVDPDSVKFNYEALQFKKRYLEDHLQEKLLVLQHSYRVDDIVQDDPVKPALTVGTMTDLMDRTREAFRRRYGQGGTGTDR